MTDDSKCPVMHGAQTSNNASGTSNREWWPNQLNISILHQHDKKSNPMDEDFNYQNEFKKIDYTSLKKDLNEFNDRLSRLVACRLWSLWTFLHSYDMARCWYLQNW